MWLYNNRATEHRETYSHSFFSSLPLESPVVVIGDRSGSMEVAIRTSTIIAALLSALAKAKLVFFNTENMDAPKIPENIQEVSN